MIDVAGKTVLVTGGAQGIGKGLARACLTRGAQVVITNLTESIAAETVGELSALGRVRAVRCDGTDRAAVGSLLADIWAQEGPVDVAFCNAGSGGMSPIIETAVEEIDAQFQVNFYSAVHLTQLLAARWIEANHAGHIMYTGSENSLVMPPGNADLAMGIYGATKHSLLIMAEWLRHELRDTQVTVSVLMPGPVLTERLAATFEALAEDPNSPARGRFTAEAEQTLRERFISTDACAEIALEGLQKGLFYVPTQAYIKDDVDARHAELTDAFEQLNLS